MEFFPDNLLSTDLQSLIDTNARIAGLINTYSDTPPLKNDALQIALDLELAAGESHFQQFLDSPTNSLSSTIFKQLNPEDCDHAERIRSYMKENR